MPPRLTPFEQERIVHAVREAESRTSGEILVAIAPRSIDQPAAALALGTALAAACSLLWWWAMPHHPFWIYWLAQLSATPVASFGFHASGIATRLLPQNLRQRATARRAREEFLVQGMHALAHGNGILLFVSLEERCAELVADRDIADREPPESWHTIATTLANAIGKGTLADGLAEAVAACGALLERHHPASRGPNEIPDHVVELP